MSQIWVRSTVAILLASSRGGVAAAQQVGQSSTASHMPTRVTGIMPGMPIAQPQPVYPPEARAAGLRGVVVVRIMISSAGTVENLELVIGPKELVESALEAVKRWRYLPYRLNGQPVGMFKTIRVTYSIGETGTSGEPAATPVSSGVMAENLIQGVEPIVPSGLSGEVRGSVVLHAIISRGGAVEELTPISGPYLLVQCVLDAVKQWKYRPYIVNGEPVRAEATVAVNIGMSGASGLVERPADGGKGDAEKTSEPLAVSTETIDRHHPAM